MSGVCGIGDSVGYITCCAICQYVTYKNYRPECPVEYVYESHLLHREVIKRKSQNTRFWNRWSICTANFHLKFLIRGTQRLLIPTVSWRIRFFRFTYRNLVTTSPSSRWWGLHNFPSRMTRGPINHSPKVSPNHSIGRCDGRDVINESLWPEFTWSCICVFQKINVWGICHKLNLSIFDEIFFSL